MPVWHKACGVLQRYTSANPIGLSIAASNQKWVWKTDPELQFITNGTEMYRKTTLKGRVYYTKIQTILPRVKNQCTLQLDLSFNKRRPKPNFVYRTQEPIRLVEPLQIKNKPF